MQLTGWKHVVLSTRIGMCRKENLPILIFTRSVVFLKSAAGYSVHKLWSIRHQQTTMKLILANKVFSYLPTSWLDKLKEVNGDSISNEGSVLYTKSIRLRTQAKQYGMVYTACEQLFNRLEHTETIFVSSSCIYYVAIDIISFI